MYNVANYCGMVGDRVRMKAYEAALHKAVTPQSVVLDIGTGIGIFAILACRYGARKVYAVEPGDIIKLARQIAQDNGVADRIEFIQDISTRISLPERADVLVSDLRSVLPLFQFHIPSIADARKRLVHEGGVLIPLHDTLWAAILHAPEAYRDFTRPWSDSLGVELQTARPFLTQRWRRIIAQADQMITEPKCWATLDYEKVEDPNVAGTIEWAVQRSAIGHGIAVWFDTVLAEGIGFSNAPGQPETMYGTAFFPFDSEVELAQGDSIVVELAGNLANDRYVWRWNTRVRDGGRDGAVKAAFDQFNLGIEVYSSERLGMP